MTPAAQDAAMPNNATIESVWSILEAANDLGDTATIEACRRVIDASLRGVEPATSDMAVVVAFFG